MRKGPSLDVFQWLREEWKLANVELQAPFIRRRGFRQRLIDHDQAQVAFAAMSGRGSPASSKGANFDQSGPPTPNLLE